VPWRSLEPNLSEADFASLCCYKQGSVTVTHRGLARRHISPSLTPGRTMKDKFLVSIHACSSPAHDRPTRVRGRYCFRDDGNAPQVSLTSPNLFACICESSGPQIVVFEHRRLDVSGHRLDSEMLLSSNGQDVGFSGA
jgi:hypothetical protein